MTHHTWSQADDEGAVAVITTVTLMAMILSAAFVIDLGFIRVDARESQTAADAASTAGGQDLADGDFEEACQQAWRYFTATVDGTAAAPNSGCGTHFGAAFGSCPDRAASTAPPSSSPADPGPVVLETAHGDYTFVVQMPVRHFDDPDPVTVTDVILGTQSYDSGFDGSTPCERIGVRVSRDRSHILAGVAGFAGGSSNVDAVARVVEDPPDPEDFANLVVLDRTECGALYSDGKGRVTVQSVTVGTETFDGYIAIDSDASGTNCDPDLGNDGFHAVEVTNNDACDDTMVPCGISASGAIFSYGLVAGNTATAYDPCDLDQGSGTSCNGKPILLSPEPIPGNRVTRKVIDHRYNCLTTYPGYDVAAAPQYPIEAIEGCGSGSPNPHIDDLIAAYQGSGVPPGGFVDATSTYPKLADCSLEGASEGNLTITDALVFFDCPTLTVKNELTLSDVEVAVFAGGVRVEGGSAAFRTNPTTPADHILYLRDGGIDRASTSADIEVNQGVIYLHDDTSHIALAGGGGAGVGIVSLISPVGPQDDPACEYGAGGVPPAQCFEDLAVWSNGSTDHTLAGQGGLNVEGTVFTPNAGRGGTYFALAGEGNQNLDHAQFVSHRIFVTGQGLITMRPDPDRIAPTNIDPSVSLIR